MTGKQVKAMAHTREKRRHRTSPATRLKVAMKRRRERKRDRGRDQARKLKNRAYSWGYPSARDISTALNNRY